MAGPTAASIPASSPDNRAYSHCYAELAVSSLACGRDRRQYALRLLTKGWPGWVDLGAV